MAFADKVVLITGANSGIGAVTAELFAKEGALLALVGQKVEKFEPVLENIAALDVENEPLVIIADVSTEYERIINETIEKYGRLDVLINNAGFLLYGTIESIQIEDFDSMFATNVRGLLLLTQLAVPHLIESKGNIVNTSSFAGMRPIKNFLGYCMTKAAIDQFTRCVALELADRGVRVNSVNPGAIHTPFFERAGLTEEQISGAMESMNNSHPLGRIGKAIEVAHAIAYFADEKNAFTTGINMLIDGGISIKNPI